MKVNQKNWRGPKTLKTPRRPRERSCLPCTWNEAKTSASKSRCGTCKWRNICASTPLLPKGTIWTAPVLTCTPWKVLAVKRPPQWGKRSSTTTRLPRCSNCAALKSPPSPAPMRMASYVAGVASKGAAFAEVLCLLIMVYPPQSNCARGCCIRRGC